MMDEGIRAHLTASLQNTHDTLEKLREHIDTGNCDQRREITSEHRGQYQTFDAYESLNDDTRAAVNALMEWSETDQENYLATRESGDWFDQEGRDPEEENWLSDALEEATGWYWEEGSLWEAARDECDICSQYPDETPEDAARQYLDEYPLAAEARVGAPLSVLFACGGPHIEIVHDLSDGLHASLRGYWGGEKIEGPYDSDLYDWVIDYFIDPSQYEDN